jgi:hypothetical protein
MNANIRIRRKINVLFTTQSPLRYKTPALCLRSQVLIFIPPSEASPRSRAGIVIWMAELSVAFSPPSLKLRRALLAIHPRPSGRGILAKESNPY